MLQQFVISMVCFFFMISLNAKEWPCLKTYQKTTNLKELGPSDWLKKDRKQNTLVWQNANLYNLEHQLPQEYTTIKQRRDFYVWLNETLVARGYEIVWPTMAHYISKKLALIKVFPYSIFTSKDIKTYAEMGSVTVFNACFDPVDNLLKGEVIQGDEALSWDRDILKMEQFQWLGPIYSEVDEKTLHTIERMAKGKGFYGLMVPKDIRFQGDITKADVRYQYALETLRPHFKKEIYATE